MLSNRLVLLALTLQLMIEPGSCFAETVADSTNSTNSASQSTFTIESGTHKLDAAALFGLTGLSVAQGATAVIDFGTNGSLAVTGDISNSGSIYAISSSQAINTATFSATNIFNNQGAVFSSILPSALASFAPAAALPLSLNLIAQNNIVNAGTISSAANLSISAGDSIVNSGTISAIQNLNTVLGSGILSNAGTIASMAGNINISSIAAQNILINNTNGSIEALLGNLSISTSSSELEKLAIQINGGNLAADAINIANLSGNTDIAVNELSGALNADTGNLHVQASTPNLTLGKLCLSGDPTFYNTGGDITLLSDIDLRPVNFTPPGPVPLAIVASGNVIGNGITKIDISTIPNNINGGGYPGDVNTGSLLIVAGANVSAAPDASTSTVTVPAPPAPAPYPGDTTATLTITGAGTSGGNIQLSGVSLSTQGGQANAAGFSGNVSLVAFKGNTNNGDISIGDITTGEYQPLSTDNTGINGAVSILAEGNIQTGNINSTGNILNPTISSGTVTIASAGILMLQSTVAQTTYTPTYTQAQSVLPYAGNSGTAAAPGNNSITLNNASSITGTVYIDPLGPDAEVLTVSSTSGNLVTFTGAMSKYHAATENVMVPASSVVINPGAGSVPGAVAGVQMTQNGAVFAPDPANINSGSITIGGITAGGDITIKTTGTVNINGNLGLTMNPPQAGAAAADWIRYPSLNITGNTAVNVNTGVTINSSISGCQFCPTSLNIVTSSLVNNGSITGGSASLGTGNYSNNLVSISSPSGLSISGSGSIEVPGYSVIALAAADNNTLSIGNHSFKTDIGAVVIINAQGSAGQINPVAGSTLMFYGAPIISINTPSLTLNNTTLTTTGAAAFAISPGYTADNMTITVSGSSRISTFGALRIRAADTKNLNFVGTSSDTLTLSSANTVLSASGGGSVPTPPITITGSYQTIINPAGGIRGVAFQPYVGGLINPGINQFTGAAAYPYQAVIALLAPIAAEQQFDMVSTYTMQYSAGFVPQAAKQLGLRVSAGVFVDILPGGALNSSAVTAMDSQLSLANASLYGNVVDIVVGNEDIVGADPTPAITTLAGIITTVQNSRNNTANPAGGNFNNTTLPVTTRQKDGVLNLVATNTTMANMVRNLDGHIYGNFYPFFDEINVVPQLIANPGMSYSQFKTLVTNSMIQKFQADANSFANPSGGGGAITTEIRVGETGWATELVGYNGTPLPQQSTLWAKWYYPAMQDWSQTYSNPQTGGTGAVIAGYFEGYNEPNKGIDGASPNSVFPVPTLSAQSSAGSGQISINTPPGSGAAFSGLTPASILLNPSAGLGQPFPATMEVQNILTPFPISGNPAISISGPGQTHNTGEQVHAGTPQEPFFGIWLATGSIYNADGSTFTITGINPKYALTVYPTPPPPTALPPLPSSGGNSPSPISSIPINPFLANALLGANAINTGLGRIAGTIVPTDINPELDPEKNGSGEPAPPNSILSGLIQMPGSTQGLNNELDMVRPNIDPNPPSSFVSLPRGNSLFMPDHDLSVKTPFAEIKIGAGAAVLILQNENTLVVFNLHDRKANDVAISNGDKFFTLPVGRQIAISSKNESKFDEMNISGIGYRNLADTRIGRMKSYVSEFSMASAITTIKELSGMLSSSDRYKRRMAAAILKTAAAMSIMGKGKEPFKAGH